MTWILIVGLFAGAVIGGIIGYVGKCRSGTCPFTASPWTGALWGALLGLGIAFLTRSQVVSSGGAEALAALPSIESEEAFRSEVLESEQPVLLEFYTPTCIYCRQLAPTLAALGQQYAGRLKVVKVNANQLPDLSRRHQVSGVPAVFLYHQGKPIGRWVGVQEAGVYRTAVEAIMPQGGPEAAATANPEETAMPKQGVTMKGNPVTLTGNDVNVGDAAPDVKLVKADLSEVKISDFRGKPLLISAVPSLDTSVCAKETKHFNDIASELHDEAVILTVSTDLPFAQERWCGANGVENVVVASDHRGCEFGQKYGVQMQDFRLLARAVFVVDPQGKVVYKQIVEETSHEPDYDAAVAAVRQAGGK